MRSDSGDRPGLDAHWQNAEDAAVKVRLVDELARLRGARDPFGALGLARSADQATAHAAFLAATKQFHPNRFARRSAEIQQLANEVFLAFRQAYERAKHPEKTRGRGGESARRPGRAPSGTPTTTPTTTLARAPAAPARAPAAPARAPAAPARAPAAPARAPAAPARAPLPSPASNSAPRRSTPPPIPVDAARSRRRPSAGGRGARTGAAPAPSQLATPRAAGTPPIGTPTATDSVRDKSSRIEQVVGAARERRQEAAASFDSAVKLLNDGHPAQARARFRELAVEHPQNRRYRVYLHYAWGREHLAAGRRDAARAELTRALGIDPHFADARRELDALSRKKPGRFLGKLFGK